MNFKEKRKDNSWHKQKLQLKNQILDDNHGTIFEIE